MKKHKILFAAAMILFTALGCNNLSGDNSDYDFGHKYGKEEEPDPYEDGYGRLDNSVRLVTYNTHRCEGPVTQDPAKDMSNYDLTARAISLMAPDAVSLQELDENTTWHRTSQIQELADRTGLHPTFGRAIDQRGGQYGNGILSREVPIRTEVLALPNPDATEARSALFAEFSNMVFIATHFCHRSNLNRTEQAKAINEHVEQNYAGLSKPVFLAGDLNQDKTGHENILTLLEKWDLISSNQPTMENVRIDYIMVFKGNDPAYKILGAAVPKYDGIDLYTVSDHLPTLVDLEKF